jgi:hypothetical protein
MLCYSKNIMVVPPITPTRTKKVNIPAPARSAVVTGLLCNLELAPVPAFTSPLLFPVPFTALTQPGTPSTRLLCTTSSTAICSPTPKLPSFVMFHLSPHSVPLLPAVQVLTAAKADVRSFGMMMSWVKGASSAVAASQRAKYALKDRWSTLHLVYSQYSCITPSSLKNNNEALSNPVTRSCHKALPFV